MAGVFHIENKAYFSFKINDVEVSSVWNLFQELVIVHGFGLPLPQLQMTLKDMHGYLTGDLAINDGTRVAVTIGKNEETSRELEFIVYGIKHQNTENGNVQVLNCVLDCPKFSYEAGRDVTDGSAIDALAAAASAGGLKHVTDLSTSDTMKWLNCGEPRHVYIQRITEHTYNGKQSCVLSVPTVYKELVTQDMFEKLKDSPVATFCYSFDDESNDIEGDPLIVEEVCPVTLSGAMNSWTNYGHVHDQHSLSGKDLDFEKANPVVMGDGLPLNKDVKGEVEGSQISWGGFFDVGCDGDVKAFNLHKYYYEAKYLNQRHRALFTEGLRVSIEAFTSLEMFDTVKYVQADSLDDSDMINQRYVGKYIVGGQVMMIRGHHYIEVLDLYRSFIEESGHSNMVGGSSSSGGMGSGSIGGQVPKNIGGGGESVVDLGDTDFGGAPSDSLSSIGGGSSSTPLMGGSELNMENLTGTDNTFKPQVPSVTDKQELPAEIAKKKTDELVNVTGDKFDEIAEETTQRFKDAGSKYKTPELLKKYGEDADYLDAAMREFSRAKDLMSMCGMLGDVELASLNLAQLKTPEMLDDLESRAEWLDMQINKMNGMINQLIAQGNLPSNFLDAPKTKLECMDLTQNSIKDAMNDQLPDACSERMAWDRLMVPKTGLEQLLDKIGNFIRDLLCSAGEELDSAITGQGSGTDSVKSLTNAVKGSATNLMRGSEGFVDDVKNFGGN